MIRLGAVWALMIAVLSGCGLGLVETPAWDVAQAYESSLPFPELARRKAENPEGYARKVARLADNPFSFYRGTTPLYYRRLFANLPAPLRQAPQVMLHGDLHVENFGVIPASQGLTFGLDDFDESLTGPVSIDLIRCLGSLAIAFTDKPQLLESYLDGYKEGLEGKSHLRSRAVAKVLRKASAVTPEDQLASRTTPTVPRRMQVKESLPMPPGLLAELAARLARSALPGLGAMPLMDAVQRFAGTASLDLFRYEGVAGNGGPHDRIVEVKELLPSALQSHLGGASDDLLRYRQALKAYQGEAAWPVDALELGNYRMLVRLRPHFKESVNLAKIEPDDLPEFGRDLGRITALSHARTGNTRNLARFAANERPALLRTALEQVQQSLADFDTFRAGN